MELSPRHVPAQAPQTDAGETEEDHFCIACGQVPQTFEFRALPAPQAGDPCLAAYCGRPARQQAAVLWQLCSPSRIL